MKEKTQFLLLLEYKVIISKTCPPFIVINRVIPLPINISNVY